MALDEDAVTMALQTLDEEREEPTEEARQAAQRKLIAELEEKFREAESALKDSHRMWKENIAFFEGIQYVRSRDGITLNVQGVGKNRIRIVDNRMKDHVRRLHARLDQVRYLPVVVAESGDQGDRQAARLGYAALRWFERRKHVGREKRKANWWIVVTGLAYLESFFDPQAGPEELVPVLDEHDQVVMEDVIGEDGHVEYERDRFGNIVVGEGGMPKVKQRPKLELRRVGDIDFVVRSPFQVYPDPRFQEWNKLRYVFVEEIAAREEVIERFKDVVPDLETTLPKPGEKLSPTPWIPDLAPETGDQVGISRPAPTVGGIIKIKRFYERPSADHPKGRHVIYTGQTVLWEGELKTPTGDFPIVQLNYLGTPWVLAGKSPIQDVKGLQKLYNRIISRYAEHLVRLPAGWLMVPITSGIPKRAFTSDTGTVIRYSPGGGKPEFVFPPFQGLAWYDRFLQRIESSMEERMALPPAVRGQMPRGARAARTVELLQEAADAIQAPVLSDLAEGWSEFYEQILDLMHEKFSIPRLIRLVGEDRSAEVFEFKGEMIPRDWRDRLRVYVEQGESLPATRMMRIEFILTLAQRHGVFGKPGTPEYTRNLLQALNLDAGFLHQDSDYDLSIAENENYALVSGEQTLPNPIDDDIVHLRTHLTFMKRLLVLGRKAEMAKLIPHVELHKQQLSKKMSSVSPPQSAAKPPGGPRPQPVVPKPGGTQPQERAIESLGDQVFGTEQEGS